VSLEDYRIHFGGEMSAEKAAEVVALWRAAAQSRVEGEAVELAAPFQRHYTKFGTGLPPNFCLVLTAASVLAFKLDPRNPAHPLAVAAGQFGKQVARWQRGGVRVTDVETGRLTLRLVLEIDDGSGPRAIPCRTPRPSVNPAAIVVIGQLGGRLPQPSEGPAVSGS